MSCVCFYVYTDRPCIVYKITISLRHAYWRITSIQLEKTYYCHILFDFNLCTLNKLLFIRQIDTSRILLFRFLFYVCYWIIIMLPARKALNSRRLLTKYLAEREISNFIKTSNSWTPLMPFMVLSQLLDINRFSYCVLDSILMLLELHVNQYFRHWYLLHYRVGT